MNTATRGRRGRGGGFALVVMLVVLGPLLPPTTAFSFNSDPLPPLPDAPPPPPSTAGVMTEPPPPRPSDLRMRPKDCPLYVLGELRGIKKHGETWLNDGSSCELCKCVEGVKRCLYHYCNVGTEVVTNPPAGRPPFDDEDGVDWGEEGEEGSGRPPPPPHYDDVLKGFKKALGDLRTKSGDNDTRPPGFCLHFCFKACPWGYKMHPVRQCRQCACLPRCPSVAKCPLRCPEGLAKDSQGCHVCQCRQEPLELKAEPECKDNGVRGCLDGTVARQVGDEWARGSCVSCRCVADGYTECNVTHCPSPAPPCPPNRPPPHPHHPCCPPCQESSSAGVESEVSVGRAEVSVESAWEREVAYAQPHTPASSSSGAATGDGAVKSAVQATGVQWWQVWVVTVPLAVLCVLAGVCGVKHWRRTHQDKYDINAYRPSPLTEKLRPVTTAEDRHLKTPIM